MTKEGRIFSTRDEVDFTIVGAGAAGGVLARELSQAGFRVVVLEQGPFRQDHEFTHDELATFLHLEMCGGINGVVPQTYRQTEADTAYQTRGLPPAFYAQGVGGSSVYFSGNYWRFRPIDFKERSVWGSISGTGFSDWPISYEELEPYYSKVEWEIGVSGMPGPHDPPRSRPYPLPPMPVKSSGVLFERGASKLGLTVQSAPVAILSDFYRDRSPCVHCGFCAAFGCEMGAKSSTLVTMIPEAIRTGNCEIRPNSTVLNFSLSPSGHIRKVIYLDEKGNHYAQRTKACIISANGAETPRLLLSATSSSHPQGLANSSGLVGKYLMFNSHSFTNAIFDEPLNEYKSIQTTRLSFDFYESDARRGFYGGGALDGRSFLSPYPIMFALGGLPPDAPKWGSGYKRLLAEYFPRKMTVMGSGTSLPLQRNSVSLDPQLTDKWGRPALRITYRDHDDDLSTARFLQGHAVAIMEAAGAKKVWGEEVLPQSSGAHLLGTCRMGDDPAQSVVDRFHRSHDVANLFICDGSSLVSSGRGEPTMTIQALAFRAAHHIGRMARQGSI